MTKGITVTDLRRIWWCARERQAIWPDDFNRPSCGPDMQCTGGRRRSLDCGWHYLLPEIEPEDLAPPCLALNPLPHAEHHGRCLRRTGHTGKHDDLFTPPWGEA